MDESVTHNSQPQIKAAAKSEGLPSMKLRGVEPQHLMVDAKAWLGESPIVKPRNNMGIDKDPMPNPFSSKFGFGNNAGTVPVPARPQIGLGGIKKQAFNRAVGAAAGGGIGTIAGALAALGIGKLTNSDATGDLIPPLSIGGGTLGALAGAALGRNRRKSNMAVPELPPTTLTGLLARLTQPEDDEPVKPLEREKQASPLNAIARGTPHRGLSALPPQLGQASPGLVAGLVAASLLARPAVGGLAGAVGGGLRGIGPGMAGGMIDGVGAAYGAGAAPAGHRIEGGGRGKIIGMGAGAGAGLGGLAGFMGGQYLGGNSGSIVPGLAGGALGALLGGYGGGKLTQYMIGAPSWEKEPEQEKQASPLNAIARGMQGLGGASQQAGRWLNSTLPTRATGQSVLERWSRPIIGGAAGAAAGYGTGEMAGLEGGERFANTALSALAGARMSRRLPYDSHQTTALRTLGLAAMPAGVRGAGALIGAARRGATPLGDLLDGGAPAAAAAEPVGAAPAPPVPQPAAKPSSPASWLDQAKGYLPEGLQPYVPDQSQLPHLGIGAGLGGLLGLTASRKNRLRNMLLGGVLGAGGAYALGRLGKQAAEGQSIGSWLAGTGVRGMDQLEHYAHAASAGAQNLERSDSLIDRAIGTIGGEWFRPGRFIVGQAFGPHVQHSYFKGGLDHWPRIRGAMQGLAAKGLTKQNSHDLGYGFCPICGAPGIGCERSIDGNTHCANGHDYPHGQRVFAEDVRLPHEKRAAVMRNSQGVLCAWCRKPAATCGCTLETWLGTNQSRPAQFAIKLAESTREAFKLPQHEGSVQQVQSYAGEGAQAATQPAKHTEKPPAPAGAVLDCSSEGTQSHYKRAEDHTIMSPGQSYGGAKAGGGNGLLRGAGKGIGPNQKSMFGPQASGAASMPKPLSSMPSVSGGDRSVAMPSVGGSSQASGVQQLGNYTGRAAAPATSSPSRSNQVLGPYKGAGGMPAAASSANAGSTSQIMRAAPPASQRLTLGSSGDPSFKPAAPAQASQYLRQLATPPAGSGPV